ncbi:response regulator transcription factor [Mobilicoccus pelagius]|uniref:Putative two-component response regulator n=1 Tax=Mobilicoccus pelagius NBRC 104925 TaxID=1089455 RepID=H5UV38_9MICO|nr:response regulator transcription factor [Mobilicoccus pelagius]GAB49596.1 putative two-component response regulator [Mobilicoccus pelagius NBRC 104925]
MTTPHPEQISAAPEGTGPQQAQVRAVVVDDDALVRQGLALVLGGKGPVTIVGEAADGLEAEGAVARCRPDVVLMDIRMPRRDGIAATRAISSAPDAPPVLVLTTFDADDLVLDALRAGAAGFLLKATPPERMVAAILAVAAGEPAFSPTVIAQVVAAATRGDGGGRRQEALDSLAAITEREREVAVAVGRGWSNARISAELFMSVPTVKAHVSKIFEKLGLENRVQIAVRVHDAELL